MMSSAPFFLLLSQLTGLDLKPEHVEGVPSSGHEGGKETGEDGDTGEQAEESEEEEESDGDNEESDFEDCEDVDSEEGGEDSVESSASASNGCSAQDNQGDDGEECAGGHDGPSCHVTVRRWSAGSYTLLHDTDPEKCEFALDSRLFFACDGEWPFLVPVSHVIFSYLLLFCVCVREGGGGGGGGGGGRVWC